MSFFRSYIRRCNSSSASALGIVSLLGVGALSAAHLKWNIRLDELPQPKAGGNGNEVESEAKALKRQESLEVALEFCKFSDRSPSVYHAVNTVKDHLLERNFVEIEEKDAWSELIQPGGKYFVTRSGSSGSSILAFAVGQLWKPGNPFSVIATHVDSPCLKLKPVSDRTGYGFRQVGVETYGGGLWHTWFDRDLGLAGRAFVRTNSTAIESQIVQLDEPLIRVPTVAVHWEHQNPFKFNTEQNFLPVAGQLSQETPLDQPRIGSEQMGKAIIGPFQYAMASAHRRHHNLLVQKLALKLSVHPDNIIDFDLSLYDVQKASIGGINDEFIFSARIDNLMMSFCALKAFTNSLEKDNSLEHEKSIRTLVMFDHEEIGSNGPIGAQSTFLPSALQRLSTLRPREMESSSSGPRLADYSTAYEQAIARSFLISADMHHGQHPNYPGYHESNHRPMLNNGIVFASTSRRHLAKSTPGTIMLLELICKLPEGDEPPKSQFFVFPNGSDCGSTVGPHLESKLGIRTVDLGNTALSMHSIREMAGTADVANAVKFFQLFYQNYSDFEDWVVVK